MGYAVSSFHLGSDSSSFSEIDTSSTGSNSRRIYPSCPDDLAISFDAWEAYKNRCSSDVVDSFQSMELYNGLSEVSSPSGAAESNEIVDVSLSVDNAAIAGFSAKLTSPGSSEIGSFSNLVHNVAKRFLIKKNKNVENRRVFERTPAMKKSVAGNGGVRPPLHKLPPAMKKSPIDLQGSSWDFRKQPSSTYTSSCSGNSDEEARKVEREERFIQLCSFTANEGDSSSTGTTFIITSWQKGQLLGRGSFASVYEGISGDGDIYAVKEVSLLEQDSRAQESIRQLEREIAVLSQLQHQNIIRYHGTAKDESNLYIFLELVSQGSLLKLYNKYQLTDSQVSLYTRQIIDGLNYLHNKGFIHRDIKCANILVDASGVASRFNDNKSCKGTPFWMAPEVINQKDGDGYGNQVDIWSLGCTVLEMLTRQNPYSHLEPNKALFEIGKGNLPPLPETLSPDARAFILKCLKVNPHARPTAAELLNHPFVRRPSPSTSSGSGSGPN